MAWNDKAHQVPHDELAWNQSLFAIHQALPNGLGAWLDFSATPKDQNGLYYPLDCYGLSIGPGCGRQDRQKSPYGDHGGQSETAN